MPSLLGHLHSGARLMDPKEIALTLARVPRWNGQTIVPWSVLQHSLAAAVLAMGARLTPEAQLYALWHDSEEALVGDTPSPFKTAEQAKLGDDLRQTIYRATLQLPYPSESVRAEVAVIDERLRHAEAHAFIHPRYSHTHPLNLIDVDAVYDLLFTSREQCVDLFLTASRELLARPEFRMLRSKA